MVLLEEQVMKINIGRKHDNLTKLVFSKELCTQ